MKRVPQPPVDRAARAVEAHEFWPGFVTVVVAAGLVFCGARHLTGVDTVEGSTAWETQLVKAFSTGALQYADRLPPPPPPKLDDPAANAEALARWVNQRDKPPTPEWKVRVDTEAKTPCPT